MIFADFKQDCFRALDKMGLGEKKPYVNRLDEELKIIEAQIEDYKKSPIDYFLEMADHAKKNGKIANSNNMLLTYVLGISDEDPIKESKTLIKTKSAEFPDIDMDFEDAKRDLVKEYVVEKYGRENVASIAAFGKMQAKSVIKDICRVKGIPHEEVNEVTKLIVDLNDTIDSSCKNYPPVKAFFEKYEHMNLRALCNKLEGNVRHLSQHAAGVVIAPGPVSDYCGLEKAKDNIVTCFEEAGGSKELSKLGLVKMDFLGLNTLTIIHEAVDNVRKNHKADIDFKSIKNINFDDPEILKEFSQGLTVGIFQFERVWVREMLKKMRNVTFRDIAVLNALNRPGPIEMGEKLWKTKVGEMPNTYLHPLLEPILSESYGVICYQEQGMEISQKLAGFGADEADLFRKAMSSGKADIAKGINPFEKYEKRFLEGCRRNGIKERMVVTRHINHEKETPTTAQDVRILEDSVDEQGVMQRKITCNIEVAEEIFYQIKKFAEYGFNKAHAVEYSQDAAMAMYLKRYYPIEFMASLLSNTPNAVNPKDHANKFVDYFSEAKRMKIKILPPNINTSNDRFTPTKDGIISGFGFIKELGDKAIEEIMQKRPFSSFNDFLMKVSGKAINKSAMFALVHAGCFDEFLDINGDKNKLVNRYDLLRQYVALRKIKEADLPTDPTAVDAILSESEYCGEQLFNSLIELVDLETVNKKFEIDDKMVSFSNIDKINVKTKIRVFGVVQSLYIKRNAADGKAIGFLVLKNGPRAHRFMLWNSDVNKLDRDPALKDMFTPKRVITLRVQRERDYKEGKTFTIETEGVEKLL